MKQVMNMVMVSDTTYIFEESCEIPFIKDSLTKVYEDNVDCITQIKTNDRTKHIFLKFLYIHELQDKSEINVK